MTIAVAEIPLQPITFLGDATARIPQNFEIAERHLMRIVERHVPPLRLHYLGKPMPRREQAVITNWRQELCRTAAVRDFPAESNRRPVRGAV